MSKFSEPEKNFFRCAALVAAVLVYFIWQRKLIPSIICGILVVVFVVAPIIIHVKGIDLENLDGKKESISDKLNKAGKKHD